MRSFIFCLIVTGLLAAGSVAVEPVTDAAYQVELGSSKVEWLGKKVTGQHNGTINLKSGMLDVQKSEIKGGHFVMDMQSIVCLDLEDPGYNKKLVDHLKSDDFFSVASHPTSEMKIKSVKAGEEAGKVHITGDLTIKGITHPVEFPAHIKMDGDKMMATAEITIDRAKYNVRYGSGSFFKGLGDKLIYDDFTLTVNLVGSAK
jgi:polyisoprenoid-binding protein YceI